MGIDTTIRAGFITVDPLEPPEPAVPGDFNGDRVVDLVDHAAFVAVLLGPFVDPQRAGWYLLDFDLDFDVDFDVDLADLAAFQRAFGTR